MEGDTPLDYPVADVRRRLERGELASHAPFWLEPWIEVVDVEKSARVMLSKLEHASAEDPGRPRLEQRLRLLCDRLNGRTINPTELNRPREF